MTHYDYPVKHILVPTDFSKQATNAVHFACTLAGKISAKVTTLTVLDYPGGSAFHTMGIDPQDPAGNPYIQKLLQEVKNKLQTEQPDDACKEVDKSRKVQIGNPFTHISDEIGQNPTDLVIMGTKGATGIDEILVGSNTEKVVRSANCPVISIKEKVSASDIKNIVFATSLDEDDEEMVAKLKQLQDLFSAKLHIVSVNTPGNFRRDRNTKKALKNFANKHLLKDFTVNIFNDITEEDGIIYFAEEIKADMIALGTHARKGLSHLIGGSIAADIVNHARRPVWTYRLQKGK